MRADDALKYAAAVVRERIDWTVDEIGGSCCESGHDIPLDALMALSGELDVLAGAFSDPRSYSDGRQVKSGKWIEDGVYTEVVWHPDPAQDKSRSWRGSLLHDPGTPCPGVYEVTTHPDTQEIHVRVVKAVLS